MGEWLPESIITGDRDDPARHAEMADSLSLARLVLLESLSPEQRAVLLLHDVFDYDHAQIAQIIGRSEDNVRQLATRARRHVEQRRPRFPNHRASSATSWHDGSLRPPSKAISLGWRRCSHTMSSWPATAAARCPPWPARCAAAAASRAR